MGLSEPVRRHSRTINNTSTNNNTRAKGAQACRAIPVHRSISAVAQPRLRGPGNPLNPYDRRGAFPAPRLERLLGGGPAENRHTNRRRAMPGPVATRRVRGLKSTRGDPPCVPYRMPLHLNGVRGLDNVVQEPVQPKLPDRGPFQGAGMTRGTHRSACPPRSSSRYMGVSYPHRRSWLWGARGGPCRLLAV